MAAMPIAQTDMMDARFGSTSRWSIPLLFQRCTQRLQAPQDDTTVLLERLDLKPDERAYPSTAESTRIRRRVDLALLPIMLAVYFFHALDKATLSYASVFGLIKETNLVGSQYSWLSSIVFLAQVAIAPLALLALLAFPVVKVLGVCVVAWATCLACMASAREFRGLMAARFFLGAFEAAVGPGLICITRMWWTRREQTLRVGWWYCMNGLTWVVGSLSTYGLAHIQSSLKPHQIIFLFFGVVTIAVGLVMLCWLPNSPADAKFLTDRDKLLLISRLNRDSVEPKPVQSSCLLETLKDFKSYFWFTMMFSIAIPSSSISAFGPLIIQTFVSDPFRVMLFNIPIGLSHMLAAVTSTWLAARFKVKGPIICAFCIPPIVGLELLQRTPRDDANRILLMASYFLLSPFAGVTPLIYSWMSQNTENEHKHTVVTVLAFLGAGLGNFLGPLTYQPAHAPMFVVGAKLSICSFLLVIFVSVWAMCTFWFLNGRQPSRISAQGKTSDVVDPRLDTATEEGEIGRSQTMQQTPDAPHQSAHSNPDTRDVISNGDSRNAESRPEDDEDFIYVL